MKHVRVTCARERCAQVAAITTIENFAAQSSSMNLMRDIHEHVVRLQHCGGTSIPSISHTPETITVFDVVHEAIREVVVEMGKSEADPASPCALRAALCPTLTKFAGKAFGSLCIANVMERVGEWHAGGAEWIDNKIRLPDALAAVAKLLVHIAGQAYLETAIAGASQEIQEEEGGKRSLPVAARKLSDDEKKSVPFVAARIVEELAATKAGRTMLLQGGVRSKFGNGMAPLLRSTKDALGLSSNAWLDAIEHLKGHGVLASASGRQQGDLALCISKAVLENLVAKGARQAVPDHMFTNAL